MVLVSNQRSTDEGISGAGCVATAVANSLAQAA